MKDELSLLEIDDVDVEKGMTDYKNVQIFTKLLIGSQKTPLNFVFDTGSDLLWYFSSHCEDCTNVMKAFNESESETFSMVPAMNDLHFGSGSVYGYMAKDQVCLSEEKCSEGFGFTSIVSQRGLYGLRAQGVVGMSAAEPTGEGNEGDFFLDKLLATGTIDQRVFSLYINTVENESRITYGGFDLEKFAHPAHQQLTWHSLSSDWFNEHVHWKLSLESMTVDGYSLVQNKQVIVDSGTSLILMPAEDRQAIVDTIAKKRNLDCELFGYAE